MAAVLAPSGALLTRNTWLQEQDSVTRPANTTAYDIGDTMSDQATTATAAGYFTFTLAASAGGVVCIRNATLAKSANGTTNAAIDVVLFDTLPALANFGDNDATQITDAEYQKAVGVLRFTVAGWTSGGIGGTGDVQTIAPNLYVKCAAASTALYGIMHAQAAYGPGNAEAFTLTVLAEVMA